MYELVSERSKSCPSFGFDESVQLVQSKSGPYSDGVLMLEIMT